MSWKWSQEIDKMPQNLAKKLEYVGLTQQEYMNGQGLQHELGKNVNAVPF